METVEIQEDTKNELNENEISSSEKSLSPEELELRELMTDDKKFMAIQSIMQLRNKISEINTVKEHAVSTVKSMVPDDKIQILEARAYDLDTEELQKLDLSKEEDWNKIREVFTFEDGIIHFTNNPDINDLKVRDFHRDYLIYLKNIKVEEEKFVLVEQDYKNQIEEIYKELDEALGVGTSDLINKYGTFSEYYRTWIIETLKKEDLSDKVRTQLQKTYDYDLKGIELDFIKKDIEDAISLKGNTKSIIYGYRNQFQSTAEKVEKIFRSRFSKYNYHNIFTKFNNLEERVFPEYEKWNNLFIYILFRNFKHNYEKFDKFWMITIGEIITQLGFMFRNDDERPESSRVFEQNVRIILNMITKDI